MRSKREQDFQELKKNVSSNQKVHDDQIQEVKHKYQQQAEVLNDELDNHKKVVFYTS